MVAEVDPRIHFTLNCGAESCPPIGVYHGDKLENELTRATNGFLNQSVSFKPETKTVQLSMIFQWYKPDFGGTDKSLLEFLRTNGTETYQSQFKAFEEACGQNGVRIAYDTYNWGLNKK